MLLPRVSELWHDVGRDKENRVWAVVFLQRRCSFLPVNRRQPARPTPSSHTRTLPVTARTSAETLRRPGLQRLCSVSTAKAARSANRMGPSALFAKASAYLQFLSSCRTFPPLCFQDCVGDAGGAADEGLPSPPPVLLTESGPASSQRGGLESRQ